MENALAFIVALGATALIVTKTIDFIRNVSRGLTGEWNAAVWIALSFGVGVVYCLGWGIDMTDAALDLVPALSNTDMGPTAGAIVTGFAVGAGADFWHKILANWSASTAAKNAQANG